jgi:hypothetical protein
MPTTATGLLLFIVVLLPGFAYTIMKERNTPATRRSSFRETVEIVVASTAAGLTALIVLAVARAAWPDATPDIGDLVSDVGGYVQTEYALTASWAAGLLVAATGMSGVVGWLVGRRPPHGSKMSAWWEMFESWYPGFNTHVGCTLDDGSYVEGIVNSYSDLADESPDRDLILQAPIKIRLPGEMELQPYGGRAVCISARRVVMMLVTPLTTKRGEATSSPAPEVSESAGVAVPAAGREED